MYGSNSKISLSFILAAAGEGKRMGLSTAKQFLPLNGEPLFYHSLKVALSSPLVDEIIIVTSESNIEYVEKFCKERELKKIKKICSGGKERQESINIALSFVSSNIDAVCIHDAARPRLYEKYIENCLNALKCGYDGAVIGTFSRDTIKEINDKFEIINTLDRKYVVNANTPQIFNREKLIKAHIYAKKNGISVTDDSSLLEKMGYLIKFIEGEKDNVKITFKEDLERLN